MIALNTMNLRVRPMVERVDRMSLRERGMIFAVGVVALYCIWQVLLMDPLLKRTHLAEQRLNGARDKNLAVDAAGMAIAQDPAVVALIRNRALKHRLDTLDAELNSAAQGYVSPGRMTDMLREMLAGQRGLRLVSLENLAVESVSAKAKAPAAAETPVSKAEKDSDPGPFIHPVEMVVEGDYASIVAYLHALEKMPYQIHWQKVELTAGEYPNNRVRIVIGALSLSRQWISV
jgi:MSHA biogenesis protein MshJ